MTESSNSALPPFFQFIEDFENHIAASSTRIETTLSNVFTMRLVGNKTHGDLAEIAIAEYINQFLDGYEARHVGKDLYRAKSSEEDIELIRKLDRVVIPVSLKAYGDGPLQLSTDKKTEMYPLLQSFGQDVISGSQIVDVFESTAFQAFRKINVLPLIYDEKKSQCNIMVFDYVAATNNTAKIELESAGSGRKHPCYRFYDDMDNYICEVRYGDAAANALQRGMWTNTKNAKSYFRSVTRGWISYAHNLDLVRLLSLALTSNALPISEALDLLNRKINE